MSAPRPVRVRFAPSPTGRLHIGGARTALFNWAFARRHGGKFVLRIEDTDADRNTVESLDSILGSLRWLGLDWDEGPESDGDYGPYFQSERSDHYATAVGRLRESGRLYPCFCTSERLAELRERQRAEKSSFHYDRCCRHLDPAAVEERIGGGEPYALRWAVDEGVEVPVDDLIRGAVRFASEEVEDWVAVRSNGMPTYNLVCALDDASMEITHVLRGEEHLVNTPKQVLVHRELGSPVPVFAHLPLILGGDGKKLSKRTGDTALEDYRSAGYPADAVLNYLALLGWSPGENLELFDRSIMEEQFDLSDVNPSGAVFDPEKLSWVSGEYIRRSSIAELTDAALPFLEAAGIPVDGRPRSWLEELLTAFQPRFERYADLPSQVDFLFHEGVEPDAKAAKALAAEGAGPVLVAASEQLAAAEPFPPADFDGWAKQVAGELDCGLGKLLKPMRAALAGTLGGPSVGEILALLGREESLARLRAGAG